MDAALSKADFDFIRGVARQRAGLVLDETKEYLIASRLAKLAKRLKRESSGRLVAEVRAAGGGPLLDRVVEALATNETSFFRDLHPFEGLRTHVFPELIKKRAADRRLTVWCAAASTGQEPYSVALLLREHFAAALAGWAVKVLATDLSLPVIERARAGRYTQAEVARGLPAAYLARHFAAAGPDRVVAAGVRELVEFRPFNLLDSFAAIPACDVVLMRNVLIYFDLDTKRAILDKLRRVLRPDGHLLLGGAETTLHIDNGYDRLTTGDTTTYRPRPAGAGSLPPTRASKFATLLPTSGDRP